MFRRLIATLFFLVLAHPLWAETRFALVIGNSAYSTAGFLPNATSDARLMASSLEAMGFETEVILDADEAAFGRALDLLNEKSKTADVVALYYAGHGLQKDGRNFLVPVDAALESEFAIEHETISADTIVDILKTVPISLIFLDACRNNPWAEALTAGSGSRNTTVHRGLAVIKTEGDMLITYATLPNMVASDGTQGNSPFARSLSRHIRTPDTEVSVLMKRVTADVMDETGGEQRPQQLSQMQAEFYFARTNGAPAETNNLRSLLTVYPSAATTGQEVSVVADVPTACQPFFVNLAPDGKLTPIPLQFFRSVDMKNGQFRYEISPGSQYGLVVQEDDARGPNQIGFFCEPAGASTKDAIRATLQSIVGKLQAGETEGRVSAPGFGETEFRFATFEIE